MSIPSSLSMNPQMFVNSATPTNVPGTSLLEGPQQATMGKFNVSADAVAGANGTAETFIEYTGPVDQNPALQAAQGKDSFTPSSTAQNALMNPLSADPSQQAGLPGLPKAGDLGSLGQLGQMIMALGEQMKAQGAALNGQKPAAPQLGAPQAGAPQIGAAAPGAPKADALQGAPGDLNALITQIKKAIEDLLNTLTAVGIKPPAPGAAPAPKAMA